MSTPTNTSGARHRVYVPPRDWSQGYIALGGIFLVIASALVSAIPGLRPAVLGPAVLGPPTAPETVLAAPASPPVGAAELGLSGPGRSPAPAVSGSKTRVVTVAWTAANPPLLATTTTPAAAPAVAPRVAQARPVIASPEPVQPPQPEPVHEPNPPTPDPTPKPVPHPSPNPAPPPATPPTGKPTPPHHQPHQPNPPRRGHGGTRATP